MTKRPYLDFYGKHDISPVAMSVNWESHFIQRKALYFRLGILPGNVRGRKVLEFGPGNGVNAVFTITMEPEKYVLVDGNPKGIENCRINLQCFHPGKNWKIVNSLFEEYFTDEKFDLVICEGFLPNQIDPVQMARHCSSFVSQGGLFVVTCHDMISNVSETLRSLLGWFLIEDIDDFNRQVTVLATFFEEHLGHLKGMTRTKEEWVIDNIMNIEFWKDAPLFSIEEAIDALEHEFIVCATSPCFVQDWSWYKSVEEVKGHFNSVMKKAYFKNLHNLIDWRIESHSRNQSDNRALYGACKEIREKIRETANDNGNIDQLIDKCQNLMNLLPDEYVDTKEAIGSYVDGIRYYLNDGKIDKEMFLNFAPWWGRGTQYASFLKE